MYIFKIVKYFLVIIFSIFGIFSFILFILGYRPIRNIDAFPDWSAISAIGTFLAVFVALFITKWQNTIENQKKLQIELILNQITSIGRIEYHELLSDRCLDEFNIKLSNIGNRMIIINSISFLLPNKHEFHIIPNYIPQIFSNPKLELPYKLNVEDSINLYIPSAYLINPFKDYCTKIGIGNYKNIVLKITDTANKNYVHKTSFKYNDFLNF